MLKHSERRLKNGTLLCNSNKDEKNFECFLFLHTFGVFRISRPWDMARFAHLPFIISLEDRGLIEKFIRKANISLE
jgi:hypothetical protein